MPLKSGSEAQSFTFSRLWTCPRTILYLAAWNIALIDITNLIADDELACEELLIGLPVQPYLQVDTRSLLENSISSLDGKDCSQIQSIEDNGGCVLRLMIARLNRVSSQEKDTEFELQANPPRVDYNRTRQEPEPFPDPSLLDPIDRDQGKEVQ